MDVVSDGKAVSTAMMGSTKGMSPMRAMYDLIRQGGRVQRYHAKPVLVQENVAEHSFYVAWLAWCYCHQVGKWPSASLLMACLQHDLTEAVTGDMPSPTKKRIGKEAFAEFEAEVLDDHHMADFGVLLDDEEAALLKWCDNLSGYMKCLQETQMGNRFLARTLRNYGRYLADIIKTTTLLDASVLARMVKEVEGETDVH